MKTPTVASLKKVNAENLTRLGAEQLAAILADAADSRPDLKRRLRMELAAEQGAEHLALEIDKRLNTLESSRSKVSWRKRPAFVADLEVLRALIADRLAALDARSGLARLWLFMDLARRLGTRVRDKDGGVAATFERAAADIGGLVARDDGSADALVEAIARHPLAWSDWLPVVLDGAPKPFLDDLLRRLRERPGGSPGWAAILRLAADAAGDVDGYLSTFTAQAVRTPAIAAEAARRLLDAGRVADAGRVLEGAGPKRGSDPDFEWETVLIDYLDAAGQAAEAQAARWASFERTLSVERARAFTRRLPDFEDVEAESRAFDHAAQHPDAARGLEFLMAWPAIPEAATMIEARADELDAPADQAELWAGRLRTRQPRAAHTLLRTTAAAAFRRRDFATCDRLTQEADTIDID